MWFTNSVLFFFILWIFIFKMVFMKNTEYDAKESLERIKLMMGYDLSKTLNENREVILEETLYTPDELLRQISSAVDGWATNVGKLESALTNIKDIGTYNQVNNGMSNFTEYDSIENMLKGELGVGNGDLIHRLNNHFKQNLNLQINYRNSTFMGGQTGVKSDTIKINPLTTTNTTTESAVLKAFPCLPKTNGYRGDRADDKYLYFFINNTKVALKADGTTYLFIDNNWVNQKEKTTCPQETVQEEVYKSSNRLLLKEQGANIPGTDAESNTGTTQTPETTQTSGTTQNSTGSTGSDQSTIPNNTQRQVIEFQKKLKEKLKKYDLEPTDYLGTTGGGDGVDGKLGPKTALAAWTVLRKLHPDDY
jgi:hypothetical protein